MRRTRDTIIGSRLQVQARRDTFRGAIQVETIASDVEQFRFAITDDCRRSIQIDVFQLVSRFTTESIFVAMMLLRKTVIGCV